MSIPSEAAQFVDAVKREMQIQVNLGKPSDRMQAIQAVASRYPQLHAAWLGHSRFLSENRRINKAYGAAR